MPGASPLQQLDLGDSWLLTGTGIAASMSQMGATPALRTSPHNQGAGHLQNLAARLSQPGVGRASLCLTSSLLGDCWLSAAICAASPAQQLGVDWVQLQGLWNQVDSKVLLPQEAPCRRALCPPQLHHPLFVQLLTHCPVPGPCSGC